MHWKSFAAGAALALILTTVGFGWVMFKIGQKPIQMGSGFNFFDDSLAQPGRGYVEFSGALGGGEMHSSNLFSGICREVRMTCETADVAAREPDIVGSLWMDTYYVSKWTPEIIVANSPPGFPRCVTIKLVIHRKTELVEYIRSPRAGKLEGCDILEQRTIGRVVGDPNWVKKLNQLDHGDTQ